MFKLNCSNRLISSSLLLPAKDWLLYHRGSQRVCPRLRLRQFHLPGLVALSISLAHLPSYGTRPLKFWGVERIRGVGSGISTFSSLDARSGRLEVLAPIPFSSYFYNYRLSRINWNVGKFQWFSFVSAKLNYNSAFRIAFIIWSLFANAKPLIQFDFQNCIRYRFSFCLRKLNTIWIFKLYLLSCSFADANFVLWSGFLNHIRCRVSFANANFAI